MMKWRVSTTQSRVIYHSLSQIPDGCRVGRGFGPDLAHIWRCVQNVNDGKCSQTFLICFEFTAFVSAHRWSEGYFLANNHRSWIIGIQFKSMVWNGYTKTFKFESWKKMCSPWRFASVRWISTPLRSGPEDGKGHSEPTLSGTTWWCSVMRTILDLSETRLGWGLICSIHACWSHITDRS